MGLALMFMELINLNVSDVVSVLSRPMIVLYCF